MSRRPLMSHRKYPSRRSITRSTPESVQNWVLSGFQNVFARSSTSVFDSNENVP